MIYDPENDSLAMNSLGVLFMRRDPIPRGNEDVTWIELGRAPRGWGQTDSDRAL
jgi:hypothetical protein